MKRNGLEPGKALTDAVAIGDLRDVWRVVGRRQRRPQLGHQASAVFLERRLEAADFLVTECQIVGQPDDTLELHFRRRVVAQRLHRLRRRRRGPYQVGVRRSLREIVRRGETERRHLLLLHIIIDGVELEGGERTDDDVDFVAFDQFLDLGLGDRPARRRCRRETKSTLRPAIV